MAGGTTAFWISEGQPVLHSEQGQNAIHTAAGSLGFGAPRWDMRERAGIRKGFQGSATRMSFPTLSRHFRDKAATKLKDLVVWPLIRYREIWEFLGSFVKSCAL
jgi:hypothetical protein